MFYTNICIQGNQVLERFIDDSGLSRTRKVPFKPIMYKHATNGDLKDIYGRAAVAVQHDSIGDARRWMKEMRDINREPLGMDDFILQYLYHTYSGPISFNYEQLDIAFVDIEVPTDGPFPEPHICDWEIDGICHYSTKRKKFFLFTTRPWDIAKSILDKDDSGKSVDTLEHVEYTFCASERELLIKYLKFFRDNTPDVFSGWNSEMFDLRYIVNRYRKVLGEVYANKLSPWEQIVERIAHNDDDEDAEEIITYELMGIACIDYMAAYKKFTFKTRPTYRLDYIGQVELGMRKLEMTEKTYLAFSQKNPQRYIDYLIRDVDLLVKLDARLSLMALITSVAYYAKVNYQNVFSPLKTWDAIIHNSLIVQGIVVPENKRSTKEKFAGAFVKEPFPGFYKWIMSFDLTSLYPHIIKWLNISPETIMGQVDVPRTFVKDRMVPDVFGTGMIAKTYEIPKDDMTFAANGMRYTRAKRGIIPTEIDKVFLQRKAAKNAEFTADKIATIAYDIIVGRQDGKLDENNFSTERFDIHSINLSMKGQEFEDFKSVLHSLPSATLSEVVAWCRFMEKLENVNQQARKVLINSLYGALGNQHFRYFDTRNAEAITVSGQLAIRWIMRKMNEYMNAVCNTNQIDYVVYGDTDSIYMTFETFVSQMAARKGIEVDSIEKIRWVDFLSKFAKEKCEPYIDQSYRELAEYTNAYDHQLFMDREIIADTFFITGKKRYAANVWDSEGKRKLDEHGKVVPKLKIMGIETQRSSTPVFAGKSLEKSIKLILTKGEAALQEHVAEVKAAYPTKDYREIASVSSANNIDKNHNNWVPVKGCPGHIKGALAYNKFAEQKRVDMIRSGEKIQIIMLKEPNQLHSPVLAFPSGEKIPDEFELDLNKYLDYTGMYGKHFLKPLENICEAIGWDTEKKTSLTDLFGDW